MTEPGLRWAAGVLDARGTVRLLYDHDRNRMRGAEIHVQGPRELLMGLVSAIGGTRTATRWRLPAGQQEVTLQAVAPFLRRDTVRAAVAAVVAFRLTGAPAGRGRKESVEVRRFRRQAWRRAVKAVNHAERYGWTPPKSD
jgi:hypothetical protein